MQMHEVKGSSNIAARGYDPISKTFRVRFHNGTTYEHSDVPVDIYTEFSLAESAGRSYNALIRNAFPSIRLTEAA